MTCGCGFTDWIFLDEEMAWQEVMRRSPKEDILVLFCAERAEIGGSAERGLSVCDVEVVESFFMAVAPG
jgi:hypothetical protein